MERSWLRAISSALVQERNKGLRALTPKTVVHSVKSANSRYCCPDRADSRSNVLLITVHDGRRRHASAALAFRQGFRRTLCCFRAHLQPHTCMHADTHACTRFIIIFFHQSTRWCAHTGRTGSQTIERQCIRHTRAFSLSFLKLPRMHHEHTCALDELVYFLRGQCDCQCVVITVKMLPEWFCEWKTEPERQSSSFLLVRI